MKPGLPAPSGHTVAFRCRQCGRVASSSSLETVTREEAEAMYARDLNGEGWQVSTSAGVLCPAHRPRAGVTGG